MQKQCSAVCAARCRCTVNVYVVVLILVLLVVAIAAEAVNLVYRLYYVGAVGTADAVSIDTT
jgi:hypothetical protein